MSLNCQSINAKFPEIKLLLDTFGELNKFIHAVCLQETWIENSDLNDIAQFHIDKYQLVIINRYASAHGGLAFYIHKSWNFKIRQDTTDSPLWEEIFVDIIHCKMFIVYFTVPCWQHRRQCGTVNITVAIVICLQYEIVNVTLPYCIVNNTVL